MMMSLYEEERMRWERSANKEYMERLVTQFWCGLNLGFHTKWERIFESGPNEASENAEIEQWIWSQHATLYRRNRKNSYMVSGNVQLLLLDRLEQDGAY